MHALPETHKHKGSGERVIICVLTDEGSNILNDGVSSWAVSSAVHLPGDLPVETSIIVSPVGGSCIVIVRLNGPSGEESWREGRELHSKGDNTISAQLK